MERFSDVLFVFPLYVDGIPVTLLNFLKALENSPPQHKPVVSVLINCGFLEPEQNSIAVKMIQLYCRNYGYPIGSVLKIGGGEAILTTPFRFLVKGKIKKQLSGTAGYYAAPQEHLYQSRFNILGKLRKAKRHYQRRYENHAN